MAQILVVTGEGHAGFKLIPDAAPAMGEPLVALRAPAGSPHGQVFQNLSGSEQMVAPFR